MASAAGCYSPLQDFGEAPVPFCYRLRGRQMTMETSPHLLIVDDDREIRDLLSRFLAKHGYRVSTAKDAREARRILADARIDLGILDIMMPGEDGLSLCRDLRANSTLPSSC